MARLMVSIRGEWLIPLSFLLGIVIEVLREGILFSFFLFHSIYLYIHRSIFDEWRLVGEFCFGEGRGKSQREFQSFEREMEAYG